MNGQQALQSLQLILSHRSQTQTLANELFKPYPFRTSMTIFLQGPLGAGKTTFVRSLLQTMGYLGKVKSPSYSLIESYQIHQQLAFHFDLYRLRHANELLDIGIQEYFSETATLFIEWPEKGLPHLPLPDLTFKITPVLSDPAKRHYALEAHSSQGQDILKQFTENSSLALIP